jgi:hypothetical protein
MSWIIESGFNCLVFQLCEDSVDSYTWKVGRGELLLLLCTSIATMSFIAGLDLDLYFIRSGILEKCDLSDMSLRSYRGMLQSDRHKGYLIQWALRRKDLRRCKKPPF